MARPLRIEYPEAHYHVTARGNERKNVFKSRRDREKFLEYLQTATDRYGAVIHAYCLMDNHYHLIVETPLGNLSKIMQHINGAYTMYFNTKRKRSGHLFQGRYKAILIEPDEYLKELSRYIHLNPVRAGMEDTPEAYEWSSCQYYTTETEAPDGKIVKTDVSVAKNYLAKDELESLGRIVNAYLDLAEERAKRKIPMTMEDWAKRLDKFLEFDDREILQDSGKVSAKLARAHAESEFEKYRIVQDRLFESDFDRMIQQLEEGRNEEKD